MSIDNKACKNTDRVLYTEPHKDWKDEGYMPKVFVTKEGAIGMNVGGMVIVKPITEWFKLAQSPAKPIDNWEEDFDRKWLHLTEHDHCRDDFKAFIRQLLAQSPANNLDKTSYMLGYYDGNESPAKSGKVVVVEEWMYEDEMTDEQMYDALFPLSKVDMVRMFPKKIRVLTDQGGK
jgi:hypothetical protein